MYVTAIVFLYPDHQQVVETVELDSEVGAAPCFHVVVSKQRVIITPADHELWSGRVHAVCGYVLGQIQS